MFSVPLVRKEFYEGPKGICKIREPIIPSLKRLNPFVSFYPLETEPEGSRDGGDSPKVPRVSQGVYEVCTEDVGKGRNLGCPIRSRRRKMEETGVGVEFRRTRESGSVVDERFVRLFTYGKHYGH